MIHRFTVSLFHFSLDRRPSKSKKHRDSNSEYLLNKLTSCKFVIPSSGPKILVALFLLLPVLLVVSTHLKNIIRQIGNPPQIGVKIKKSLKPPPTFIFHGFGGSWCILLPFHSRLFSIKILAPFSPPLGSNIHRCPRPQGSTSLSARKVEKKFRDLPTNDTNHTLDYTPRKLTSWWFQPT